MTWERKIEQDGDFLVARFFISDDPLPYEGSRIPAATASIGAEIVRYGDLCYAQGIKNAELQHQEQCPHARELGQMNERYERSQRAVDEFAVAYAKLNEIMALAASAWRNGVEVDPNEIRKIAHRKDGD